MMVEAVRKSANRRMKEIKFCLLQLLRQVAVSQAQVRWLAEL